MFLLNRIPTACLSSRIDSGAVRASFTAVLLVVFSSSYRCLSFPAAVGKCMIKKTKQEYIQSHTCNTVGREERANPRAPHALWGVGFASSEVSCFRQLGSGQRPVYECVRLYALTASCWSPGSCLTRRKLLTDICTRGEENTRDSASLEMWCLRCCVSSSHTHTGLFETVISVG